MISFLLNPWTVGLGVALVVAVCGLVWRRLSVSVKPPTPGLVVSYEDGVNQRSSGTQRDEVLCRWHGVLTVENPSSVPAYKAAMTVPDGLGLKSLLPGVLESGSKVTIETEFSRTFDARKLFPSRYAKPFDEVPPDVDPNRDCYPEELRHLYIAIQCENEEGQTFRLAFRRSDISEKRLNAEQDKSSVRGKPRR